MFLSVHKSANFYMSSLHYIFSLVLVFYFLMYNFIIFRLLYYFKLSLIRIIGKSIIKLINYRVCNHEFIRLMKSIINQRVINHVKV